MMKAMYIFIAVFLVSSCTQPVLEEQATPVINVENSNIFPNEELFDNAIVEIDDKIDVPTNKMWYYCDSTIINGLKFKACTLTDNGKLFLIEVGGDTIEMPVEYGDPEFLDFNEDGFEDLYIHYITNVPNINDIALYNPKNKKFELVDNLQSFPASQKISGTKYYYSYHRSGCADMNWDSDLFYIKNNKAIKIGNIEGLGCDDQEQKISIYSIRDEAKKLVETFPIDTIGSYEKFKWGFIEDYWKKNYNKFN